MAGKSTKRSSGNSEGGINETGAASIEGEPNGGNSEAGGETNGSGSAAPAPAPASAGNGAGSEAGTPNSGTVKPGELYDPYERDENGDVVLNGSGKPKKKRGRKPGQTSNAPAINAPKAAKKNDGATIGVEMLAAQFQILNMGIAFMTKFDDFKLSEPEAMQMATASAAVMEQFDYVPDPKVTAVLGLVSTTSMVYGPRLYLFNKQRKAESKSKLTEKMQEQDNVTAIAAANGMPLSMPGFN